MVDRNKDGINDDQAVSFHLRSFLAGGFIFLALGSSAIGLAKVIVPDSDTIKRFGQWFAGTSCDHVERSCSNKIEKKEKTIEELRNRLNKAEKAIVCYETVATIHNISDTNCKKLLGEK